jgi:hypothetical protein
LKNTARATNNSGSNSGSSTPVPKHRGSPPSTDPTVNTPNGADKLGDTLSSIGNEDTISRPVDATQRRGRGRPRKVDAPKNRGTPRTKPHAAHPTFDTLNRVHEHGEPGNTLSNVGKQDTISTSVHTPRILPIIADIGNYHTEGGWVDEKGKLHMVSEWDDDCRSQVPTLVAGYRDSGKWIWSFGGTARSFSFQRDDMVKFDQLKMKLDPKSKDLPAQTQNEEKTKPENLFRLFIQWFLDGILAEAVDQDKPPERIRVYTGPPAVWSRTALQNFVTSHQLSSQ